MKTYILIFFLLCLSAILYLSFPFLCHKPFAIAGNKENFVSIHDSKFMLNNKVFYPIAVNYIATLQTDGNELWARPSLDYAMDSAHWDTSKDSCQYLLSADMQLIKLMGFNTVRIVGIGEIMIDDSNKFSPISIWAYIGNKQHSEIALSDSAIYQKYFNALSCLFESAKQAGLKLIFLTKLRIDVTTTEDHLAKLAARFRNDSAILAYDFFNEPLYFDTPERNKHLIHHKIKEWNNILKKNAPLHLSTIGLEGIREVFEWDPNILDVDFVSFHPYEYEPEQVRNEIYWYGKYVKKPWIIGETAIPADDDSVKYETQRAFAEKVIRQTVGCGAIGFSWWQYRDVDWRAYHANYMGILNRTGETKVENFIVKGTPKPVAEEIKKIDFTVKKDSCVFLENYYDYSNHKDCRIKGTVVDENEKPIEGGVILAWNQWWSHSYHTVTKSDGSFEVRGNFPFYHWMASATEYSMVRGDVLPDTAKKHSDGIPTMDIGTLKIKKLHF